MAAHVEESTSRVVGAVAQLLESEIEAVVTGTAAASARNTQAAADGLREEVRRK